MQIPAIQIQCRICDKVTPFYGAFPEGIYCIECVTAISVQQERQLKNGLGERLAPLVRSQRVHNFRRFRPTSDKFWMDARINPHPAR